MNNTGFSRSGGKAATDSILGKGFGGESLTGSAAGSGMFSYNSNPASLKGKIQQLEDISTQVSQELQLHKKELTILNAEKDSLSQVLNIKAQDVKKTLMNELIRLEDEINRHFGNQKQENARIQSQLTAIKADKEQLDEIVAGLDARIKDLEYHIGNKESN